MSDTPPAAPEPTRTDTVAGVVPRRFFPIAAIALALGILLLALGYLADGSGEENGDPVGFVIVVIVTLAIGYLVWRYVVLPRAGSGEAGIAGIIVGVLAVLFGFVFWTGLGYVLAPAAIALGVYGREGQDRQMGSIALVLGWLGLLAAVLIGTLDAVD